MISSFFKNCYNLEYAADTSNGNCYHCDGDDTCIKCINELYYPVIDQPNKCWNDENIEESYSEIESIPNWTGSE